MPRIHDPEKPKAGPGSVFASTSIQGRGRRRKRRAPKAEQDSGTSKGNDEQEKDSMIGQDLLDWEDENALNKNNNKRKKIIVKEPKTPRESSTKPSPRTPATQPSTTKKAQTPKRALPSLSHVRHALLVDTRVLDTEEGKKVAQSFLEQTRSFLARMAQCGAPPFWVASCSLSQKGPVKSPRGGGAGRSALSAKAVRVTNAVAQDFERRGSALQDAMTEVFIRPPSNAGNVVNKGAIKVPVRFLANASWNLFGDLVEAIATEERDVEAKVPINTVILTNDLALLCDTREEAHKQALNRFWRKLRNVFRTSSVQSIEILVIDTGSAKLDVVNYATKQPVEEEIEHQTNDEDTPALHNDHAEAIMKCIQSIQKQISSRSDTDYKANRGRESSTTPVVLSISLLAKDQRALHSVRRKWLSQIVSPPDCRGQISFELPETIDGTQCAVRMDIRYKILPFRANSTASSGLLKDLKILSSSKLEVVQLVPLSCIDASLVFGVPMAAVPGFENNLDQFNEMKSLIHFLLQYLSEREMALLLRSSDRSQDHEGGTLYHANGQTLLLMAEELPGEHLMSKGTVNLSQASAKSKTLRPVEAMLFRYASMDQVLDVGDVKVGKAEGDHETLKQLGEYVEASLEELETNFINPLVADEPKRLEKTFEGIALATGNSDEEIDWNDDSGVGAIARQESPNARKTTTDSTHDSVSKLDLLDNSSDNGWNDNSGVRARVRNDESDDELSEVSETEPKFCY